MARRGRQLAESEIYHVMLRGVNRDAIFLEDVDRQRFLTVLAVVKEASGCQIFAYCLMTNHVHLVLRVTDEPLAVVVKRIGVRYAGWFNHRYGRVGHLFQDRFTSRPVEDDAYLVALLRYVWRNPVEAGLADRAEDYPWSSRRFLGRPSLLLDEDVLAGLVPAPLGEIADRGPDPADARLIEGEKQPRHTDGEAARLVRRVCGLSGRDGFNRLGPSALQRAVSELRTRSVSYAQIARATGMSVSTVRRLHLSAPHEPVDN